MKKRNKPLTVLVTAGPTRAYLDKVRYLSNYSSGQLGYEICREIEKENKVIAVVGPCEAPLDKLKNTDLIRVETVEEMHHAVMHLCKKHSPDFAVLSAAVLDFAPKKIAAGKRSSKNTWNLQLVPTPKIIDEITKKFPKIKKVAFKLEWKSTSIKSLKSFAMKNLKDKSAEVLCLNFLSEIKGKTHPAFLFTRDGKYQKVDTKKAIAHWINRYILSNE